jgi:hypothetical protein
MKTAFDKAVEGSKDQINAIAGGNAASAASGLIPKVDKVEKLGDCQKKSDKVYACSVKVTATAMGRTESNTTMIQFAKTSDGWTVIEE